jgi:hypothetical protein
MKRNWLMGVTVSLAVATEVGYLSGRARASALPSSQTMAYSGVLTDTSGKPLPGPNSLQLFVWDSAMGGTQQCSTLPTMTPLALGNFTIMLPDECAAKARASADLWLELYVDGSPLPRTKITAVPYALETVHAVEASNATGALAAKLQTLTDDIANVRGDVSVLKSRTHTASAFRARLAKATSLPNRFSQPLFEVVDYDLASEYNNVTGVFSPKEAGLYLVSCELDFNGLVTSDCATMIYRNGVEAAGSEFYGYSNGISPQTDSTLLLAAGDVITCHAFQNSGADQALFVDLPRNVFAATRIY